MELDIRRATELPAEGNGFYPENGFSRRSRPARGGEWSESALRVLHERYLIKRDGRVVETPDEMCWRVACAVAGAEGRWDSLETVHRYEEAFYEILVDRKFM